MGYHEHLLTISLDMLVSLENRAQMQGCAQVDQFFPNIEFAS